MDNILEIENVCKKYNSFCLEDISFSLKKGYIMGLIGPNGSGKTTIIKAILNSIRINKGNIRLFGLDIARNEIEIKQRLGYIPDKCYFSESWTANDVQMIMSKIYPSWNNQKYEQYLDKFQILPSKTVKDLSRGMQTMLMLSALFSRETELLVLDEPLNGLDPVMRDGLNSMMREYIQDGNKSIIYSTHLTDDLEYMADFITFMINGRMIFSHDINELKESFFFVQGGLDVSDHIKAICVGVRVYEFGFEALVTNDKLGLIPDNCIYRPANIDELLVYFNVGVS